MNCLFPFAAQSRRVIFHNLQILKQTQAAVGEQRPDSDSRQPGQRRGPLAPSAAPHQSHAHLLLRRPGAGSRAAESPLEGPATSPFKQSLALSLPSLNQLLLRTALRAATTSSSLGLKKATNVPQATAASPCNPECS